MAKRETPLSYILEISDWEYRYSFGLQWRKEETDPFWESESLTMDCRIVQPDHINASTAVFTIWPMDELESSYRNKLKPRGYGWISVVRGNFNANVHVPTSKIHPLMSAIAAGKIWYFDLTGANLFRGRADIKQFSCWREMDDESIDEIRALWASTTRSRRSKR